MPWAWECLLPNEEQNNQKQDSRGGAEDAELTTQ